MGLSIDGINDVHYSPDRRMVAYPAQLTSGHPSEAQLRIPVATLRRMGDSPLYTLVGVGYYHSVSEAVAAAQLDTPKTLATLAEHLVSQQILYGPDARKATSAPETGKVLDKAA